jgi:hypothetical protein
MKDVVITRRERDVHRLNYRHERPGIFGQCIDSATGKELDRQAAVFQAERERATLFGWRMPWGQSDEALRRRVFLVYQIKDAPPPCIHNVWGGYDSGVKCLDCGEWLCWVSPGFAAKMILFVTNRTEGETDGE